MIPLILVTVRISGLSINSPDGSFWFPPRICLPRMAPVLFIFICICTAFLNSWITMTLFDLEGIFSNAKFIKTNPRPLFSSSLFHIQKFSYSIARAGGTQRKVVFQWLNYPTPPCHCSTYSSRCSDSTMWVPYLHTLSSSLRCGHFYTRTW